MHHQIQEPLFKGLFFCPGVRR
ncbi:MULTISPECIES: pyrBI operon leader peptide [Scandinavium]|uniref:pyr operon leader peptide n=1 Tax=Scandinavium lactucae TaxID=3095028 RepID=A0ABU4QKI1_9ENTR|nr:pyrBI operon leader peptide [Scandinavium sp. V105_6]MDX6038669.1 pyrBI operon leader peptide [Scandinavium sp. V105_6]